jgi:thiol-disulfide isomerase/thioredoxin
MSRIFLLSFLMVVGCSPVKNRDRKIALEDVQLMDLTGEVVDITQFKGKTILINFWATWCKPCLQEMPSLANVQTQLQNEPIVFLFASNETLQRIIQFKNKQNFEFNYFHLANLDALNIQALPTTFIFDSAGELKFSETGFRDWNSTESKQIIAKIISSL